MTTAVAGPADLRDQKWLDQQVATLGDGIEAVHNIWTNWHDGRNVGRLHPDMSPGEYIASLGLRLTLAEAMAALPDGSTRQIAAAAGVGVMTVQDARVRNRTPDEPPARVTGADGKSYPARVVREVVAQVLEPDRRTTLLGAITVPLPAFKAMARTFERDVRSLVDTYRPYLADARFATTYGPVLAAIEDAITRKKTTDA